MALAILEYLGPGGDGHRFRARIGTNRYFKWVVGDGRHPELDDGFSLLTPSQEGALMGPLGPEARSGALIEVPAHAFDGDNRHVQLLSFREQDLTGPAASEIMRVGTASWDPAGPPLPIPLSLRQPSVGLSACMGERRPVSTTMFLEMLAPILQNVLPSLVSTVGPALLQAAGPVIGNLLGGLTGGGQAPAAPAPPAPGAAPAGQIPQMLLDLLQRLIATRPPGAPATPPAPPAAPPAAAPPATPPAPVDAQSLAQSLRAYGMDAPTAAALSTQAHLSQAFILPALMAALPALMPLLQQVLTPQTVQSIISTADPNRLIGSITSALQGLGQLGLQGQLQLQQHLERLNPGVNPQDLEQLMLGMSLSSDLAHNVATAPGGTGPRFERVTSVTVHFADLPQTTLAGRPQTCVRAGQAIQFPLAVETPKPIPKARLWMEVKDAETLAVAHRRSWALPLVSAGRLDQAAELSRDEASKLEVGRDYLVWVYLTWQGKSGRRLGTSKSQLVSVVGRYSFDRVEQDARVIALNDVDAYREFWHKAWQGTFDEHRRRIVLNCKYRYGLDATATSNAQMESITDTQPSELADQETGTLQSGLIASVYVLNRLVPRIAPSQHPLDEDELAALSTPAFADRFSQAARAQVSFRGRPGDSAALWVYPEVKVQPVVLQEAVEVSPAGHVLRFGEHRASFPFFVLAHFIGVASQ